jgi:hypothetical protein
MNKKMILIWLLLIGTIYAQTYHLNGYAGFGYARFMTDMDLNGLNKNGYNAKIRLMWQPEHLLSVGLESGYHHLYSYDAGNRETQFGTTDAHASLTATPLFLVAGMKIFPNTELLGGIGPTFLHSYFESYGSEARSNQISTSYFVAGRYEYPVNESLAIGGELNYYHISKIEDATLSLQFILSYRLLSW